MGLAALGSGRGFMTFIFEFGETIMQLKKNPDRLPSALICARPALHGVVPAVDPQVRAGHEARGIAGEKDRGGRDLVGLAEAADRNRMRATFQVQ